MAAICDMAKGRLPDRRYFLGIIHDWIKAGFMRKKEVSFYIQIVFIVCCLLLTAPNKEKIISVSHITDGVFWVYYNIVTCTKQKLKNFIFFICLVDNHVSPYF